MVPAAAPGAKGDSPPLVYLPHTHKISDPLCLPLWAALTDSRCVRNVAWEELWEGLVQRARQKHTPNQGASRERRGSIHKTHGKMGTA